MVYILQSLNQTQEKFDDLPNLQMVMCLVILNNERYLEITWVCLKIGDVPILGNQIMEKAMVIHQWIQRAIWTVTCHCRISDKLTWRHQVPAPCMSPPHPLPKRLSNEPLSTSLATNKLSTAKVPGLWSSLAQMRLFLFV